MWLVYSRNIQNIHSIKIFQKNLTLLVNPAKQIINEQKNKKFQKV